MKKVLLKIAATLCIALILLMPISALAAEEAGDGELTTSETETDGEKIAADTQAPDYSQVPQDEEPPVSVEDEAYSNIFADIYSEISAHASEIFSVLSFIGSIIIMLAYKRGFLPTASEALKYIKAESDSLKCTSETGAERLFSVCDTLSARMDTAEKTANELYEAICNISSGIKTLASGAGRTENIRDALIAEYEMLYEVFMAASLPQYEKDRIGERFASMKKKLTEEEGDLGK